MDAEPEIAEIGPTHYVVNEDGDQPEKRDVLPGARDRVRRHEARAARRAAGAVEHRAPGLLGPCPPCSTSRRRAGVSPMTVSRVVNGSGPVSPALRARVERALAETGYMPNTVARNLRARRTDTIALVLPDMTNPFFTTLAHGVETAAREADISLVLANSDEREDEERRLVPMLLQRQVDGLLIVPAGTGEATVRACAATAACRSWSSTGARGPRA